MAQYVAPKCLDCQNFHGRKVPLSCDVYKDGIPDKFLKSKQECTDYKAKKGGDK